MNTIRHLRGTQRPVKFKVEAATVIEVGDLVWSYTSTYKYVKPASAFPWDTVIVGATGLASTQQAYALVHVGVAMQQHLANDVIDEIMVDTSADAIFRFNCASATFVQGTLLGPAADATTILLEDQKLVAVASKNLAIFVVENDGTTITEVTCSGQRCEPMYPESAGWNNSTESFAVTAVGSTQAHALVAGARCRYGINVVGGADATTGCGLPPAVAGKRVFIKNTANAVLKVWPFTDDAINAIAANSNFVIAAYSACELIAIDGVTWYSNPLVAS